LAHLALKRLQIDTDFLRIIASTADELYSGTNIDDLEPPKYGVFRAFFAISGCKEHLKSEFLLTLLEVDKDNLHTKLN